MPPDARHLDDASHDDLGRNHLGPAASERRRRSRRGRRRGSLRRSGDGDAPGRRQGLDVLIVDRANLPTDTLSTHSIGRGGVVQLARWGLLERVVESGTPKIHHVKFHVGDDEPFDKVVKNRAGVDHLVAPRRYVLDEILLDGAREAGAAVETGVAATSITRSASGRVTGVVLRDRDGTERRVQGPAWSWVPERSWVAHCSGGRSA